MMMGENRVSQTGQTLQTCPIYQCPLVIGSFVQDKIRTCPKDLRTYNRNIYVFQCIQITDDTII
jgi:hypothetical protein